MKLTNPKNGEVFNSRFENHMAAHACLAARLIAGDFGDNPVFAQSIHDKTGIVARKQQGSNGQLFYLHKLAEEGPRKVLAPVAKRKFDLTRLVTMLTVASASGLKFPRMILTTKKGVEVRVSIAGKKSKHEGSVMIAATSYPGPYYGRVMPNGDFFPGKDLTPEVEGLLVDMAHDPVKTAAAQGKLTGKCCFCCKPLDDPKSVTLGFGPVCAKKFGLMHSKKAAVQAKANLGLRGRTELFEPEEMVSIQRKRVLSRRRITRVAR